MTTHCRLSTVAGLLECHQAAWNRFNAAWAAAPSQGAPECDVEALTKLHTDLWEAAPASMAEFFAKWRQIAKFEAELGEPGSLEAPQVITQMLDELQAINGRWCGAESLPHGGTL
jgi:hypothetical protein